MPFQSPIFAPAIALVLWSLVMLAWLAATRLPAMTKAGIPLMKIVGSRGVNLEGVVPDQDPATAPSNHSPKFFVDEAALVLGTRTMLGVAVDYLEGR